MKLQCWLAQGRDSSFYHLAAFGSIISVHGFLYKALRYVIDLSLGAIGHGCVFLAGEGSGYI